jgi:hypothetical protein
LSPLGSGFFLEEIIVKKVSAEELDARVRDVPDALAEPNDTSSNTLGDVLEVLSEVRAGLERTLAVSTKLR